MSIEGVAGILAQTAAGALIDATRAKRSVVAPAAIVVTAGSLLMPLLSTFWLVAMLQAAVPATGSGFAPAAAAIGLGTVGHERFARRTEAFNRTGNASAAAIADGAAPLWGQAPRCRRRAPTP